MTRTLVQRGLGMIAAFSSRGLEAASKFALYALAARVLGGQGSGEFFLCLSIVHFVTTVARLGMERPLTRHTAAELAVGRRDVALKKAAGGAAVILASSLAFGCALALAAGPLAAGAFHDPALKRALLLSAVIVPAQNIVYTLAYLLTGLDRGAAGQLVMNALPPTLSLVALLLGARTVDHLLMAYCGAFLVCAVLGAAVLHRAWRRLPASVPPPGWNGNAMPGLWRSARPLFVVELVQAGLLSLPIFALGYYSTHLAVSEFSIASRLMMLISTIVLSIGSIVAPAFASHHRRGEFDELRRLNRQVFVVSAALCLPLLGAMIAFAGPLFALLGSPSQTTVNAAAIMGVGQAAFCLAPCQDTLLAMTGHDRVLRTISVVQLAVAVALCAILIPPFAVIGAAIASSAIWTLGAVACGVSARRIWPRDGAKHAPLQAAPSRLELRY